MNMTLMKHSQLQWHNNTFACIFIKDSKQWDLYTYAIEKTKPYDIQQALFIIYVNLLDNGKTDLIMTRL